MEDFVGQLHDRLLLEYILDLQQVMLEAWEVAVDKKFRAQENIQRRQQPTRSIHQFQPVDLFFKRSIPQCHIPSAHRP
jgi:hypothetical protein